MDKEDKAAAITAKIGHYTGTETFYRHAPLFPKIIFTDGVKFLAETGDCFWLIDKISACQMEKKLKGQEFQVWHIEVKPDSTAHIKVEDGNGNVLYEEWLEYTDFPLPEFDLWVEANGEPNGRTILLPSEH